MHIAAGLQRRLMVKSKNIKELFEGGSKHLTSLQRRSRERSQALLYVRASLPEPLGARVTTAGLEDGRLTIGVSGGAWAARLRYLTESLRESVGLSMGIEIRSVRIKVVQPHI
jgi:Dna[CI] antecedent, DciA